MSEVDDLFTQVQENDYIFLNDTQPEVDDRLVSGAEVIVAVPGPQGPEGKASTIPGPKGDTGEQGPRGPAGAGGASYTHTQPFPALIWTIQHNLGYKPTVTVFDSEGSMLLGWKIDWENDSILLLRFTEVQSGVVNAS